MIPTSYLCILTPQSLLFYIYPFFYYALQDWVVFHNIHIIIIRMEK